MFLPIFKVFSNLKTWGSHLAMSTDDRFLPQGSATHTLDRVAYVAYLVKAVVEPEEFPYVFIQCHHVYWLLLICNRFEGEPCSFDLLPPHASLDTVSGTIEMVNNSW